MRLRIPPGRAGRLWLRKRLAAARKAAELLDHKRRELEVEFERISRIAERRRGAWEAAVRDAEVWLGRIDATGGERALRLAGTLEGAAAEVKLEWQQVMGVRYPTDYEVRFPDQPPIGSLDGGAALVPAFGAYRRCVEEAVAHATASAALGRIREELQRTVRRARALELRVIPAHEDALRKLELALDERDREDSVKARWATEVAPGRRRGDGEP